MSTALTLKHWSIPVTFKKDHFQTNCTTFTISRFSAFYLGNLSHISWLIVHACLHSRRVFVSAALTFGRALLVETRQIQLQKIAAFWLDKLFILSYLNNTIAQKINLSVSQGSRDVLCARSAEVMSREDVQK